MLVDKLIYDVKERLRAQSADAVIVNARILHLIDVLRAKYIRQHQQRNPGETKVEYTQTMFFDLERVDRSYLPATVKIEKEVLRTVKALPRLVGRHFYKNIEIRPVDRISQEIEEVDKTRAIYAPSVAPPNFIFAFRDDDQYLYFIGDDTIHLTLKRVAVTAILEVPTEIVAINNLTVELSDYPLPEHMWSIMLPELMEGLYKELNITQDVVDDNKSVQ